MDLLSDDAADSSPAPEPTATPSGSTVLAQMSESERAEWFKTGNTPDDKAPSAEPAAAKPVEQAVSTETTQPPSEAAKPKTEARFQEILSDRAKERARAEAAERELYELRAKLQPAQPAPTKPQAAPSPAAPASQQFPTYEGFLSHYPEASYEQYLDARAGFVARQTFAAAQHHLQQQQQQEKLTQQQQERADGFRDRLKAAGDADFLKTIAPAVLELRPFSALMPGEQPTARHAIAEELLSSPIAPQIMKHFTEHPEMLEDFAQLAPAPLLRAFGKLEAMLGGDKQTVSPSPTITNAPPPPTTLGKRPAAEPDDVEAAVKAGNFTAYAEAANRREMAARKR